MGKQEGYSVNLVLEMLRAALRDEDPPIPGILVKQELAAMGGDDPEIRRHFSVAGKVQCSPAPIQDVRAECWLQRRDSSSSWTHGQVVVQVLHRDGSVSTGFKLFYRYDERDGLERIRRQYLHLTPDKQGGFSAHLSGAGTTKGESQDEAVGKLIFAYPEFFGIVVDHRKAE